MLQPIFFLYAAAALVAFGLLKSLVQAVTSPLRKIPGPFVTRFTKLWYLRQIYAGHFEQANIDLHKKHGPIVRIAPNMYSIVAPEKTVYGAGSKFTKSDWYDGMKHPSPNIWNPFSDRDVKRHNDTRKKFSSMYSMSSLVTYEPHVDSCTRVFVQRMSELADKQEAFDMSHWFLCYAFDIIGELTHSERFGFLDAGIDIADIFKSLRSSLLYSILVGVYPKLHPYLYAPLQYLPGSGASGRQALMKMNGGMIAKRMQERKQRGDEKEKKVRADLEAGNPRDFLDRITDARDENPGKVTDYHIFMMSMANIIAGGDTTGISFAGIFYELMKHPAALKKLRDEVDAVVAQNGKADDEPMTWAESHDMPYLHAVIKESMRVHPPIGLPLWREVPEGGAEIYGQFLPAGTAVGVNTWVAHFNADVYGADVHEFRPERWIEAKEEGGERLKQMEFSYMPFGLGSRTCMGMHISMLQLCKVIPQILRKFEFSLDDPNYEWDLVNHWVVRPVDLQVRVRPRA